MSSFTHILSEDLLFSLIDHVCDMVVGVEKIIGIYNHPETEEISGITLQYTNHRLQEHRMNLTGLSDSVATLRRTCQDYRWLEKSQLPFDITHTEQLQRSIFDENKHLTLLIALPGSKKSEKDILIIYFKDHIHTFGVQRQNSSLSTDNKTIIAKLLSGSINSFCKLYWKEKEHQHLFANKTQRILEQQRTDSLTDRQNKKRERFICSWANAFLSECSDSDGVNYVYSEGAIEKIRNYTGEFGQLKKALQEAVDYTKILITDVTKPIQPEYIELVTNGNNPGTAPESHVTSQHLTTRQQNVYDYLDRLEAAAIEVDRSGLKLIGSNIGSAMKPKPISAPALSDYIRKNKEAINNLYRKYPGRWSFVKNNFSSIIHVTANGERQVRRLA